MVHRDCQEVHTGSQARGVGAESKRARRSSLWRIEGPKEPDSVNVKQSIPQRGNLAAVMKTMGHRDVKTAMHYQHPELDVVRAALGSGAASETACGRSEKGYDTLASHPQNHNHGKSLATLMIVLEEKILH